MTERFVFGLVATLIGLALVSVAGWVRRRWLEQYRPTGWWL